MTFARLKTNCKTARLQDLPQTYLTIQVQPSDNQSKKPLLALSPHSILKSSSCRAESPATSDGLLQAPSIVATATPSNILIICFFIVASCRFPARGSRCRASGLRVRTSGCRSRPSAHPFPPSAYRIPPA